MTGNVAISSRFDITQPSLNKQTGGLTPLRNRDVKVAVKRQFQQD